MLDYATSQMTEDYQNTVNAVVRDPKNFDSLWGARTQRAQAAMAGLGMVGEEIGVKLRQQTNDLAKDALGTLADAGDYENGLAMIGKLRTLGAGENMLKRYETAFNGKQIAKNTGDSAEAWLSEGTNLDMPGEEAWEAYKKKHPLPFRKTGIATGNEAWDKYDGIYQKLQEDLGWDDATTRRFKAMGMQESTFNPDAVSSDGYDGRGIYQFDADTARENGLDPEDRFDPEKNILAAARMFDRRLRKYGGDIEKAELAHNGGEGGLEAARANGYLEAVAEKESLLYGDVSPEEAAAYEETQKNAFLAKKNELLKAKRERISSAVDGIQMNLFDMQQAGKSSSDELIYLNDMLTRNPELKESGSFRSLLLGARNAQLSEAKAQGKISGEAQNKILSNIKSRIGIDILSDSDLDETFSSLADKGVGLSPAQVTDLKQEIYRASHGEGKYGMNPEENQSEVASITGMDAKAVASLYDYMKNVVKQKMWEYKQEKKHDPGYAERKAMWMEAAAETQLGPVQEGIFSNYVPQASPAQLRRLGINSTEWSFDGKAIDAVDIYGNHHYIPSADWEDVKNGVKSLSDFPG